MSRRRRQLGGIDRLRSGRYRVRATGEATGERVSLGTFAAKADAEQALAKAIADQGRGRWVRPDAGSVPLEEYARQWVASRLGRNGAPLRRRVRDLYESQLRLHILPSLGRVPIGKLRPGTIRTWYAAMIEHGPGASTVAKCYRLLHAILNTAVDDGILAANPCSIRGAGAEHPGERKLPTLGQVYELADRVKPRYRALVLAAAFSGLRRGELFGLRRGHIDLDHGTVTVEVQRQQLPSGQYLIGPPKSDAGIRTVALPREVTDVLADHVDRYVASDPSAWVFTGDKGGPLRQGVWQHEWVRAREAVGLPDLHFHDLRHVAATLAAETGAGVKEIMYRIGHSSPLAALRYQHATHRRDRSIADGISTLITRECPDHEHPPAEA
ncbi:MAG TPA: tyrosine-type recombinase/integrase [Jiangellaceae bacterium]|nr:tyrosine-type recombinase/integrase [Jiangellaceae bacterium]